ncbi:MAG: acyltransferase family protein, partial [Verrucomicrobiota bacterium]
GFLFFYAWQPSIASWLTKLKRRFWTLLLPYLTWSALGIVFYYIVYLCNKGPSIYYHFETGIFSWPDVQAALFQIEEPYQLWFMADLMIIMVVGGPLLALLVSRLRWFFIPVVLIYYYSSVPMILGLNKTGVCMFCLGATFGYMRNELILKGRFWPRFLFVLWILTALAYAILSLKTDWNLRWLFRSLVLVGLLGIWGFYDMLPPSAHRWLAQGAPYRFFIYVAHEPWLTGLFLDYRAFVPSHQATILIGYFLLPTLIVLLCIGAAISVRRRSEVVYYYLSGGR